MLRKLIYKTGILVINNNIFEHYRFLMKSQHWGIEEIQEYQFKILKELLNHAYENSKYYKDKYDEHNFHPAQIKSLSDVKSIPIITKQEVLDNSQSIQINNLTEKLVYSKTSGSTGKPFVFYRNKDWDAWHRASVYRGYSWHDVKPWEKNGYIWGYTFSFWERLKSIVLDYFQNHFRLFSYKDAEIDKFIKKLKKAAYLEGYSSMIYEVAKRVNGSKRFKSEFNLKMIKGTSETILEKYQNEVEKAFGRRMISEYGAAEAGVIAFECPQGNMHINMETAIVEEENDEIIVTNLVSKSFPIIRYKIGDYIKMDTGTKCKCGMKHLIIEEILGRSGKILYGKVDEYPSFTVNYVFKNLAVEHHVLLNYQAIQRNRGYLEINIDQELTQKEKVLIKREFSKYCDEDLVLEVIEGVDLKSIYKKKTGFISKINES